MQKLLLFFSLLFALFISTKAQNISGQWKGSFVDNSSKFGNWGGDKCEYVLELEVKGSAITGYSYTYFMNGEKRYYTICKLKGTYNKAKKYAEVTEYERTKTNVPVEISNCFQTHKLTFFKKIGGDESLEGSWVPAPNQQRNCGFGVTELVRRNLKNSFPGFKSVAKKPTTYSRVNSPVAGTKKNNTGNIASNAQKTQKSNGTTKATHQPTKKVTTNNRQTETALSAKKAIEEKPETITEKKINPGIVLAPQKYEKRSTDLLSTIQLVSNKVKVDLYDNGEIDGDSISVFLNSKLLLSHKKLTTQPISFTLNKDELNDINELVMYAENLGSIPPNTALMVVTDGNRRYEVRITSDLQKSGTIRFIKKEE